ncbi:Ig-like domain-containing protein [Candidatus Bathyarchaeota archaeon]|nr:Ig-like domain-containing protein [Candidatus Bathyarchaeota archaeon]
MDDNNDGTGHTGPLPNGGDGTRAEATYIGHCEWVYPWISQSIAAQCHAWPPPSSTMLWVKVENDSSLASVKALMVPPDLSFPSEGFLLNLEEFEMFDYDHDGNYTVTIPSANFTNHATGTSNFTFIIVATELNGMNSFPCVASVEFTETGQPPTDSVSPSVYVYRPLDEASARGTIVINGTMQDEVCLQKAELYVDGYLSQSSNLPPSSSSYFQFALDTSTLTNGHHNITVNAYDTSNNYSNDTIEIWVLNNVHDLAMVYLNMSRTIIAKGTTLNIEAIIVNQGTYTENATVAFQLNSTVVETRTVENMEVNGVIDFIVSWNTSEASYDNYNMTIGVSTVPNETDTENNACVLSLYISIIGDLTGPTPFVPDGKVDVRDVATVARLFGANYPNPLYNPNCDINDDLKIDVRDVATVSRHFGDHYP